MRANVEERIGTRQRWTARRAVGLALGSVVSGCLLAGCGDTVRPLDVLINRAAVTKELVHQATGTPSPMAVDDLVRRGNMVGDEVVDTVRVVEQGKGLEIQDGSTQQTARISLGEYVTGLALLPESGAPANALVVVTYPNADRGETFRVFRLPETAPKAEWKEARALSDLGTTMWNGKPAVFYVQPNAVVVRGADGALLSEVRVPRAEAFSHVFPGALSDNRTVVLLSGDGHTPYHAVAVVDGGGEVVFHEQADEHAWRLTVAPDGKAFEVETRSKRWRYKMG